MTTGAKERPILFSGAMVRAILDGRKTQTRRLMKQQPSDDCGALLCKTIYPAVLDKNGEYEAGPESFGVTTIDGDWCFPCRYGKPGDHLWVRETWSPSMSGNGIVFAADMTVMPKQRDHEIRALFAHRCKTPSSAFKWKPSIHMPRWASRITLEVTEVRVQRLQEISEQDALAEGIGVYANGTFGLDDPRCCMGRSAVVAYMRLWDHINGKGSWDANAEIKGGALLRRPG